MCDRQNLAHKSPVENSCHRCLSRVHIRMNIWLWLPLIKILLVLKHQVNPALSGYKLYVYSLQHFDFSIFIEKCDVNFSPSSAVFLRLETTHSEPLVRRALGYITAANHGVTWTELEDLLSLDDTVMADVVLHHGTAVRRLPSALWCRLKSDLEPYLKVNLVDNVQTYRWRHEVFHQVATDR